MITVPLINVPPPPSPRSAPVPRPVKRRKAAPEIDDEGGVTLVVRIPGHLLGKLEAEQEFSGDMLVEDTASALLTELLEAWRVPA